MIKLWWSGRQMQLAEAQWKRSFVNQTETMKHECILPRKGGLHKTNIVNWMGHCSMIFTTHKFDFFNGQLVRFPNSCQLGNAGLCIIIAGGFATWCLAPASALHWPIHCFSVWSKDYGSATLADVHFLVWSKKYAAGPRLLTCYKYTSISILVY